MNGLTVSIYLYLYAGVYDEMVKLLKPLHDHPQLHNAFLEYCLPPFITHKLNELLNTVRVHSYANACIESCVLSFSYLFCPYTCRVVNKKLLDKFYC